MAYTKYSLTPADNNAAPPNGAPEGMLPSAVNDTMRDMMSQIRDVGDGIRGGTYTMTAPVITGGSITGVALSGNTLTNPVITGGSINNTTVGATTRNTGAFTTLASNGATTFTAGTASTSTTTGTAVITGGLGVSGRINAANFDGIVGANTAAAGNFTTLGATGVATFSAGTVSAPAITTTGDTNTGIYFPAADTIAFTEGGVESMRIDSAGNVGIGLTPTASGYGRYEQIGHASETLLGLHAQAINTNDQRTYFVNNAAPTASAGSFTYYKSSANATAYQQTAGAHIWQTAATGTAGNAITFAESMRIDSSGNIGIGTTTPGGRLTVSGTPTSTSFGNRLTFNLRNTNTSGNQSCQIALGSAGSSVGAVFISSDAAADGTQTGVGTFGATDILRFVTTATERMRIDASGNLGLGVTPSAWGSGSVALQRVSSSWFGNSGNNHFGRNYYNDSVGAWRYINTDTAERYYQGGGSHVWLNAASGTAGNSFTWTQAMTLDASGNLGIGTSSPATRLDITNGYTTDNNTSLTLTNSQGSAGDNGAISFRTNTGSGFVTSAQINSGPGSAFNASYLKFRVADSSQALQERMRIDSNGNVFIGTTTAGGKFNVSGITNTTASSGSFACSNNAGVKILTGNTSGTLTTVATLTKPAGNSPMRRVVFTVSSTNDGSDTGYAVACSVREVLFSNYGGSTHILKSTELSNNIGSINAGVVSVALTTAAALSGTSVLLQATATITGSASSGLTARLMTKVEIISDSIYQDITFA